MTVKELIDVSSFCDLVEVVVRDHGHGKWIQGYTVGKNAKLCPCHWTSALREKYNVRYNQTVYLEEGVEEDAQMGNAGLPMKIICKDVRKIPDYIGKLQVCEVQPRNIPHIHKDGLTHNDFAYDIDCFPDGYEEPKEEPKEEPMMKGQLSVEDLLNGTADNI